MENTEGRDQEIAWLFNDAITKLENIQNNSKQQKKQVIKDLAKSLEEKIPTDTICIEITNQLRGQASDSFVRQCLDEKYKQSHRAKNAKKQNKNQTPHELNKEFGKLASVTTLNQEDQNDNMIMVEAYGQSRLQENEDKCDNTNKQSLERRENFVQDDISRISTNPSTLTEPKPILEKRADLEGCPDCLEYRLKVIELSDALEKSTQFVIADKTASLVKSMENSDIIQFECRMKFDKMQKFLAQLFPKIHSYRDVWFWGRLSKNTSRVISFDFGRTNQL